MGMAGFILKNTLSDNGTVTRGVSVVDENGLLSQVHETTGIMMGEDGKIKCDLPDVQEWISPEDKVSMNMWAAYPEFLEFLAEDFKTFLSEVEEGDLKKEYLLPNIVDKLLKEGRANVKVLETQDRWFGVTYQEDKETVMEAFNNLVKKGGYYGVSIAYSPGRSLMLYLGGEGAECLVMPVNPADPLEAVTFEKTF